jgi:hypothetical protein
MGKDKQEGQKESDNKNYLVDQEIDTTLSEADKNRLKMSREETDVDEEYLGRQDIFTDRRDLFRDDYDGKERRSGDDRRKQ